MLARLKSFSGIFLPNFYHSRECKEFFRIFPQQSKTPSLPPHICVGMDLKRFLLAHLWFADLTEESPLKYYVFFSKKKSGLTCAGDG